LHIVLLCFLQALQAVPPFNALIQGEPLNSRVRNLASINRKHRGVKRISMSSTVLGVDHECDGRTDRQTERPLAIARSNTDSRYEKYARVQCTTEKILATLYTTKPSPACKRIMDISPHEQAKYLSHFTIEGCL